MPLEALVVLVVLVVRVVLAVPVVLVVRVVLVALEVPEVLVLLVALVAPVAAVVPLPLLLLLLLPQSIDPEQQFVSNYSEFLTFSCFSRFPWRDFKPQNLLLVGGFKIQLLVKMQYPWVLRFDKKLYFEASNK